MDNRQAELEPEVGKQVKYLNYIDPKDHSVPISVEIDPDRSASRAVMDVDAVGIFDVDVAEKLPEEDDVDLIPALDAEFKGTDVVELDRKKASPVELDIDMYGGFDF